MAPLDRFLFRLLLAFVTGCVCVIAVATEQDRQTLLIDEDFSEGLENWVWVAPPDSTIEITNGAVLLDPLEAKHRSPGTEGINLWHRQPLKGDWAIEFDLEPLQPGPAGGESCNLLFMLDYGYEDGERDFIGDIASETGHYPLLHGAPNRVRAIEEATGVEYHPKRGYTITYYRINPREDPSYRMVVRRNPGFHLVHQENQTREDQWDFRHTVRIERRGRVLRLFQNEKLALEATDGSEKPLPSGGYFGIRTWKTKMKLHGVRAYRLEAPTIDVRENEEE